MGGDGGSERGRLWETAASIFPVHFSIICNELGLLLQYFFFLMDQLLRTKCEEKHLLEKQKSQGEGAAVASQWEFQGKRQPDNGSCF